MSKKDKILQRLKKEYDYSFYDLVLIRPVSSSIVIQNPNLKDFRDVSYFQSKNEYKTHGYINGKFVFKHCGDLFFSIEKELISLNNYFYYQHKDLLENNPTPSISTINVTERMMNDFEIHSPEGWTADDFPGGEDGYDMLLNEYMHFEEEYIDTYKNYMQLYSPGFICIAIIILIEKYLLRVCEEYKKNNLSSIDFRKDKNQSIIDGRLQYLQKECGLNFSISPRIAELIFKARVARNKFAHGDMEGIKDDLKNMKASELFNVAFEIINITLNALENK